jgi:hypothetical protein
MKLQPDLLKIKIKKIIRKIFKVFMRELIENYLVVNNNNNIFKL